MKKLIISSLALLAITNCSSGNDNLEESQNNTDNTPILVTKFIEQNNNSGNVYVTNFKYNGDKIIETSDTSQNDKTVFTYDGDNIVKTEDYENGVMIYMREFTYSNGKVATEKVTSKHSGTLVYTKTYQYITDNHIKYNEYSSSTYNPTTGVHSNIQFSQNDVILSNGNIATLTSVYNGNTTTFTYNHDTKNNPLKNIRGYLKINLLYLTDGELSNNNLLSSNGNYTGNITATTGSSATHTYNSNNYPTKTVMTYTSSFNPTNVHTYQFEYNK